MRHTATSDIKVELFNAQSLTNKSCLIHDHILEKDFDLFCVTETWHKPDTFIALNECCPTEHSYFQKARSKGRGGGLAVIYRNNLDLSSVNLPEWSSFECLAFKSNLPTSVLVLLIYQPPKPNTSFISEMSHLLSTICVSSANIIILGDFNIHVDTPTDYLAAEFLQLLDCFNLRQHVHVPTHKGGHTLDLVITNATLPIHLQAYDLGVSDHKAISLKLLSTALTTKLKRQIRFRNIKNIDTSGFVAELQCLCRDFTSADEALGYYNTHLSNLLDSHAPIKTRTVTFSCSAPWYSNELRKMKTVGWVLERRYTSTGLTVHKQMYRAHQRAYAHSLKLARSQFFSDIIGRNPGCSKQLFKTVNCLLTMKSPSTITTDAAVEQCNRFMAFFTSKISSIRRALSGSKTVISDYSLSATSHSFTCFPIVTSEEIQDIIRKMRTTTCPLDPLPTTLVKTHLPLLTPIICSIVNLSMQSGHVPSSLKKAIIRPILKKPTLDLDNLVNYRPISNLSFISKVLEKAVAMHLQNHLSCNNLYEKFQSGFCTTHSTETALVRIKNDLLIAADNGFPSILILLDLSAAFDTVDHDILLHRLQYTAGFSGPALDWFSSYLTNRSECVALGDATSEPHIVTCGMPQGSVLGLVLFNLYLLPLGQIINKHGVSFHCYADDTQLYVKATADEPLPPVPLSSPSPSLPRLVKCLEEIKGWMEDNFLQLNSSKTEAIMIGTPHQIKSSPIVSISFLGHSIPLSSSVTNLGVRMDPQLNLELHINLLCKISFYHLRSIAKLRPVLTLQDAEKLVHAFVSSRLDYCNALFVSIPNKSLLKLQHIKNAVTSEFILLL